LTDSDDREWTDARARFHLQIVDIHKREPTYASATLNASTA
jgi:hypothetical protein